MLLLSIYPQKDMKTGKGPVCWLKSFTNWVILSVLFAVILLLYHDPFFLLWWPQKPFERNNKPPILPLDMATESIDDMFDGCRSVAASMIDLFGVFEWHFNRNFSAAWAVAERHAKKPAHRQLKDDHAIALQMYTQVKTARQEFNKAVQRGKHMYSTYRFRFHYLYFYLTDAITVLHQNTCRTTYYRTKTHFDLNVINVNMRFGAFTWVSSSKHSFKFNGNVSCFEIDSCFGADITYYSASTQVGQVLIPPYEVFQITDILTDDPWCTVVYKLQSTKIPRRDLNCQLSDREMNKYFEKRSMNYPSSSVMTMSACFVLMAIISLVLIKLRQKCFVAAVIGALLVWTIILLILRVSL